SEVLDDTGEFFLVVDPGLLKVKGELLWPLRNALHLAGVEVPVKRPDLGLELVPDDLGPFGMVELEVNELVSVYRLRGDLGRHLVRKGAELAVTDLLGNIRGRHGEPNLEDLAVVRRGHDH